MFLNCSDLFCCKLVKYLKCKLIKCKLHQIAIRYHLWWNANSNKPSEAVSQLWWPRNPRKSCTRRTSIFLIADTDDQSGQALDHVHTRRKAFCDWKLLYFIWWYHLIKWKTSSLPTHLFTYVSELGCVNPWEHQSLVSNVTAREQNLPVGRSRGASLCRSFQMTNYLQGHYKAYFHMDVRPGTF